MNIWCACYASRNDGTEPRCTLNVASDMNGNDGITLATKISCSHSYYFEMDISLFLKNISSQRVLGWPAWGWISGLCSPLIWHGNLPELPKQMPLLKIDKLMLKPTQNKTKIMWQVGKVTLEGMEDAARGRFVDFSASCISTHRLYSWLLEDYFLEGSVFICFTREYGSHILSLGTALHTPFGLGEKESGYLACTE